MPKKENKKDEWDMHYCFFGKKLLIAGGVLFIAGLLRYMGYDWSMVMMIVGALLVLKGLLKMHMKM